MTKKENIIAFLQKFRAQEIAAIVGVFTFALLSIFSFAAKCGNIRTEVLRLHVIANSDTEADQNLKLQIRDRLLTEGADIFNGSVTADEARDKILPEKERLEAAATEVARENGYDYDIKLNVTEEYFDTRVYENFTLPAGKYNAVKVIIGSGEGKNWWCVMFPPLCLPAAEEKAETAEADINMVFSSSETKLVESSPKFEIRFKIVELYEKFIDNIKKE